MDLPIGMEYGVSLSALVPFDIDTHAVHLYLKIGSRAVLSGTCPSGMCAIDRMKCGHYSMLK